MIDKEKIYIEKREFVEKLNFGLKMLPEIKAVEYRNIRDKYSEFLRITRANGEQLYINVTGTSLEAIAHEISREILGISTDAIVSNEAHRAIVEGWFEAAR